MTDPRGRCALLSCNVDLRALIQGSVQEQKHRTGRVGEARPRLNYPAVRQRLEHKVLAKQLRCTFRCILSPGITSWVLKVASPLVVQGANCAFEDSGHPLGIANVSPALIPEFHLHDSILA